MKDKTFETKFKRRKEGKTNYAKRLALIKSKKIRIVIRKTNTKIIAQAIKYNPKGDETLTQATSTELKKYKFYGTNNTPSAYLTGLLLGKRMKDKEAILDIGRKKPSYGGVIFATLKGLLDAGINIPHTEKELPKEERINGKILEEYMKTNSEKFSKYEKNGMLGKINENFEKTKEEILKVKK
jgi:large subunit ribosomal protein L18